MAKIKATHVGECQACGNIQKLPNGVIAKHAFDKYGVYADVCVGTGNPPLEVGRKVLVMCLITAHERLKNLRNDRHRLLSTPKTPEAVVEVVTPASWRNKVERREWALKTILEDQQSGRFFWKDDDNNRVFVDTEGLIDGACLQTAVQWLNRKRADALSLDIERLKEYAVWCKGRYDSWAEKKLQPVEKISCIRQYAML